MRLPMIVVAVVLMLSLVLGCAPAPATPTAKPAPPTAAPAAPTAAPKAPAAPTAAPAAPTAAPKPAPPTATPAPKVKRGGTLTVVSDFTYPSMDPHLATFGGGSATLLIFDTLLQYPLVDDKAGKFQLKPQLAESWKVVDPTTIDLTLRKGVKFHDGSDFNAEVARWNLDRMINYPKSQRKAQFVDIAAVEATGDTVLRLKLKAPSATVLLQLSPGGYAIPPLISKAALEKLGEEHLQSNAVGSGPMKFERWVRDDRVVLKKFDGYWEKGADGQPLPYLESLVERFIPDKSVAVLELRAKNVDVVHMVDPKDVATMKATPDLVYWDHPWGAIFYNVFFNPKKEPYASNVKLRRAAYHAIDGDSLIKALGFGLARPYRYPFWTPVMLGYDESLPYHNYDLAKAKQFLGEAGYPTGIDVNLKVINRSVEVRMSEALKAMLDAVGFRTTVDVAERLGWISAIRGFQYDMAMNRPSNRADADFQGSEFLCDSPGNWSAYCNPEMDKCMAEGRAEYNEAKRAEIYKRCQRILYEDAAFGTTFFLPSNVVYHKKVKDLQVQFSSYRVDARAAWIE